MREITSTLKAAGQATNQFPLTKVFVEKIRMDKPEEFAGDELLGSDAGYQFDFLQLDDGRYFRVRAKVVDGVARVQRQHISDPTNTSQWTDWYTISQTQDVGMIAGSGVACWASGSTVDVYFFRLVDSTPTLCRVRSTDWGFTWSSAETVYSFSASQDGYFCTCCDDRIFFTEKYGAEGGNDLYTFRVAWYEAGWQSDQAPYREGWLFPSDQYGYAPTSVKIGERILIICTPEQYGFDSEGGYNRVLRAAQPYSFFYREDECWGPLNPLLPLDEKPPATGYYEYHQRPRLSNIGGKYFLHLQSRIVLKSDLNLGFISTWYFWSKNGESWSTDTSEVLISGYTWDADSGYGISSAKKCFVSGGYFYEVGWGYVFRGEATDLVGYSNPTDISGKVLDWSVSGPEGIEAAALNLTLENPTGEFNDHAVVKADSRIVVQGGYKTSEGDELTNLGTFGIDQLNADTERTRNRIVIQARDNVKRLKQIASRARIYLSQAKFVSFFDAADSNAYFLRNIGSYSVWEFDTENERLKAVSKSVANWALAGMDKLDDFFVEAEMRFGTSKAGACGAGLVFAAQETDCQDCYVVQYDPTLNGGDGGLRLSRFDDGSETNLASGANWVKGADTDFYIKVIRQNKTFFVYRSDDCKTWTFDFSYTDWKHREGYTGLYAVPASAAGSTVEFSYFFACGLGEDWTVEEILKDAATKTGVEEFDFAADFEDDFDRTNSADLGPKWSTSGKSGSWWIDDNMMDVTTSGRVRSTYSSRNLMASFDMQLAADSTGGVILRSNSDLTNYYFVGVEILDGVAYAVLYETVAGSQSLLSKERIKTASIEIDRMYSYSISLQSEWISLWCEGIALRTFWTGTFQSAGYFGCEGMGSGPTYWDNIRIGEMDLVVPLWVINASDVYEDTVKTLVAEVAGYYFFDGDGKLKARVAVPSSYDLSFRDEVISGRKAKSDLDWFSVARVDGEYAFATYISSTELLNRGWRYMHFEMRELGTPGACYEAAQDKVEESLRKLELHDFSAPSQVALEKWDRIHYENQKDGTDSDSLVKSLSFSFTKRPVGFMMTVGLESVS